ncbi:MAG: right-handed parallel beta-helix repeat-containing protein [Candidatus Zixiibacteriota bacterium]|nr:MAG: right-handed parallel beta-helix repeat-containing protein [candidate division Zixibacteria bacterium]
MRKTLLTLLCLSFAVPVLAQPQISGSQSGNLGPGTYLVVGDINVPAGQTLTVAPGTTFLHNGYWNWRIYGLLNATGTAADSIKWLRQQPFPNHRWAGLRFQSGAPSGSVLSYCVVEYGYTPTNAPTTDMGGCIYTNGVPLTISHSRISYGDAWWGGGGICANGVNGLNVNHCLICDNRDNLWKGGGIFLISCTNANISYNVIARNSSSGT